MVNNNDLKPQYYEDEIDLFEIMSTLWKGRKLIALTTATFLVLSFVFSVFIIKPTYETNLNISISMPEIMNTKYGELTMPMKTSLEYVNIFTEQSVMTKTAEEMDYGDISLNAMKLKFTLPSKESNLIDIKVTANSKEEVVKLAETAYNNYTLYLDLILKNRALATFEDKFNVSIEQNNNQIANLEKSLASDKKMLTSVTNQINSSISSSNKYGSIDYVALGEALGYAGISTTVLEKEQQINQFKEDNEMYKKNLEEIEAMKTKIQAYYETGDKTNLESENFDFVSQNVQLLSKPRVPKVKAGPNIALNLAVGMIVGIMIGMFAVFTKEYYKKVKENRNI